MLKIRSQTSEAEDQQDVGHVTLPWIKAEAKQ